MAELDSGPSGNTHSAAGANQKASHARGKGGPGIIKMEGMHLYVWFLVIIDFL